MNARRRRPPAKIIETPKSKPVLRQRAKGGELNQDPRCRRSLEKDRGDVLGNWGATVRRAGTRIRKKRSKGTRRLARSTKSAMCAKGKHSTTRPIPIKKPGFGKALGSEKTG